MRVVQVVIVLVIVNCLLSECSSLNNLSELELNFQLNILHNKLSEECPSYSVSKQKLNSQLVAAHLEMKKYWFNSLLQKLEQCIKINAQELTSTPLTSTSEKLTTPATIPIQPVECQQAVNYTQSWRRDYKGSEIRPGGLHSSGGHACDLNINSTQWFRFSGAAGTHMLDSCPKWLSCGTVYPYWTDERMPTIVGVEATVLVYGTSRSNCKGYTNKVQVMRCSWDSPNDLIYKYNSRYTGKCATAFCGMM